MSACPFGIDQAIQAVLKGGEKILSVYDADDFEIEQKGDGSPLTRADRLAHDAIAEVLEATAVPILSEEGVALPTAQRQRWDQFWLVDPLDGTKEFIKRNGEFTVNVALIEKGAPTLGAVYAPARGLLYAGVVGEGAYLLSEVSPQADLRWEALVHRGKSLPIKGGPRPFRVVGSRSHASPETQAFVEHLKELHPDLEMSPIGSSLKLCLVAEGAADVYPRFAPTMEWDTAAADAIVRAAGCVCLKYDEQAGELGPLEYNKDNLLNPWFVVRAP